MGGRDGSFRGGLLARTWLVRNELDLRYVGYERAGSGFDLKGSGD